MMYNRLYSVPPVSGPFLGELSCGPTRSCGNRRIVFLKLSALWSESTQGSPEL